MIIPARNEEACLGDCLESLLAQTGVAFEIIVVDDHSTDRTREIASSFSDREVHVIEAGPLPAGWTGKNNAVTAGSKAARGEWFLFTDADTIHLRDRSRAASKRPNVRRGHALLFARADRISFWEKAVMPVVFAELALHFRPSQVSDPKSPAAAANGQYILIMREAYQAVGGHAAIACQPPGRRSPRSSRQSLRQKDIFRYAGDAVRTRMYRNFPQLREGWTKNLALLFPSPVRLAVLRALEFVLIVASFAIAVASIRCADISAPPSLPEFLPSSYMQSFSRASAVPIFPGTPISLLSSDSLCSPICY